MNVVNAEVDVDGRISLSMDIVDAVEIVIIGSRIAGRADIPLVRSIRDVSRLTPEPSVFFFFFLPGCRLTTDVWLLEAKSEVFMKKKPETGS